MQYLGSRTQYLQLINSSKSSKFRIGLETSVSQPSHAEGKFINSECNQQTPLLGFIPVDLRCLIVIH